MVRFKRSKLRYVTVVHDDLGYFYLEQHQLTFPSLHKFRTKNWVTSLFSNIERSVAQMPITRLKLHQISCCQALKYIENLGKKSMRCS